MESTPQCLVRTCRTTEALHINGTSRLKDGSLRTYYICRPCKTTRQSRWRQTPRGKALTCATAKRQTALSPEKVKARRILNSAVRNGSVTRKPCEVCGSPDTDAHHADYSKPLEVEWLCRPHHSLRHPRRSEKVRRSVQTSA